MEKLKSIIREHDRLYVLARWLRSVNDSRLYKLVKGYYENSEDNISVILNKPKPFCLGKSPIYRRYDN